MALHSISKDSETHWEIDPYSTSVEFSARRPHLHRVHGQFRQVRGSAVAYGQRLDDATIEVDMEAASIDTGLGIRDRHLRGPQFIDVDRFPSISFRNARVEDLGEDQLRVVGDLTIRGITKQVALDATVERRDSERAQLTAGTVLDRRDFKIGSKPMGLVQGNGIQVRISLALTAR